MNADLRVFEGHFEGRPVVPGVAQLDWAIGWGREVFAFTGGMKQLDALKFQALMLPGHRVRLSLEWNADRSVLTFRYTSEQVVYSSGRVTFST